MTKLQVLLCSLFLASASISQSIDIFHEISKGNYKAVKSWVKSKPDVSIRDGQGQSIVHAAVVAGDIRTLGYLLSCKPDLSLVDNAGKTALDVAIDHGNEGIIFKLVYKKALVSTVDNKKYVEILYKNKFQKQRMFQKIFLCLSLSVVALIATMFAYIIVFCSGSGLGHFLLLSVGIFTGLLLFCPPCWLITWSTVKYIYDSYHIPNYHNKFLMIDHALSKEY